jgi:hypothetical protein
LFNVLFAVFVRWLKNGSLAFAAGLACAVGAKANVPFAGWHKIELKKMCGGENKKYRSVGNECRLTRCPIVISFLCLWSPVKMVYFFSVLVVCLLSWCRPLHLLPTLLYPLKTFAYTYGFGPIGEGGLLLLLM